MKYDVKNLDLAEDGKRRIEWAEKDMPVLKKIRARFARSKPLKGMKMSCCLHVTTETANLMLTLKSAGAEPVLCASNPLSTQDDVAAALVKYYHIPVFAIKGENTTTYYDHIVAALAHFPRITMDDGADLVSALQFIATKNFKAIPKPVLKWFKSLSAEQAEKLLKGVIGSSEETTTGVIRLRAMERDGVLRFPVIAVNEAQTKHLFDNRYGTGQSTVDGILRATNRLFAGSNVVVCGYGWCGRGVATRARGMGANVIITEVDPLRALEAVMDGYRVMPLEEAAPQADIFVTVSGDINVIDITHFQKMKDGAIVCNAGHFDVEINLKKLANISKNTRSMRPYVTEYTLENGKNIYVLAEGRLINLSSAEGHPACVMDMSFANQAMCACYLKDNAKKLENKVYGVPTDIDEEIARLKLYSMGVKIDKLTKQQQKYLVSWEIGT